MKFRYKKNILFWLSIAAIITLAVYFGEQYLARHPNTDNAYVQANTINVAAQVTGPVAEIFVQDHQLVRKNQLLFTIDPQPFQIAVDKATATVAAQRASLLLADQNAKRILHLVSMNQESKAAGDQRQSELDNAKAKLAEGEAELARAKLNLTHTSVVAPHAGITTQFLLRPGNNVVADNTLFMIVEQNYFWLDANFKETQIEYIKPNQPVKIILDMYPKHPFNGVVGAISSASGAIFSLLPPENASGNWVKVTQRFPVKILFLHPDAAYPLRVGATASVTIDTTRRINPA
jgi:membrane fusion protein (multidrug efflux system)